MMKDKKPMAEKTSKSEAAMRKVERMLSGHSEYVTKKGKEKKKKPMAVKLPGKMGPPSPRGAGLAGERRKSSSRGGGGGYSALGGKGLFNRFTKRI